MLWDFSDPNLWNLFAPNAESMQEAKCLIESSLEEDKAPEFVFGEVYTVKISEVKERGCMVDIHPAVPHVFIPNTQLDARKVITQSPVPWIDNVNPLIYRIYILYYVLIGKSFHFAGYAPQCPRTGGRAGNPGKILRAGPGFRRDPAFQAGPHGGNSKPVHGYAKTLQKSHPSPQPKTSCQQGSSMLKSIHFVP